MKKIFAYTVPITLLLLLAFPGILRTQYLFTQSPNQSLSDYLPDLAGIEINYTGVTSTQAKIKIEIYDTAHVMVGEGSAPATNFSPGIISLSKSVISTYKWAYHRNEQWSSALRLIEGSYLVIYRLIHPVEDIELAYYQFGIQITPEAVRQSTVLTTEQSKKFSFHGTGEVSGQLATRPQNFSDVPVNYIQGYLNPTLTIFDVPISAQMQFSSQQQKQSQNINMFSINFDGDQFKNILIQKLLKLITENEQFQKLNEIKDKADINQYKSYQDIFNNPEIQKELMQLAKLDSMKGMLDSLQQLQNMGSLQEQLMKMGEDSLKTLLQYKDSLNLPDSLSFLKDMQIPDSSALNGYMDQIKGMDTTGGYKDQLTHLADSMKNQCEALKWLEKKREGYEKLMAKKGEIEDKLKKSGLIDSTGNFKNPAAFADSLNTEEMKDPEKLYSRLKSSNLLGKFHKVLYYIDKINIGTCYPKISDFTLNNQRVTGFNMAINPKRFFASATYGQVFDPVYSGNLKQATYKRDIISGTLGVGNPDASHFFVTMQRSKDDSTSINPRDSVFVNFKTPQMNYVISAHFALNLLKDRLKFSGEVAGSQTTRDLAMMNDSNFIAITGGQQHNPSEWFQNIFLQRTVDLNTTTGYAISAKAEGTLFRGITTITGSFKRISPHFRSFGVPFMVNDIMSFEAKVTQKIWKNRISLMGLIRHNSDNLENTKILTTHNIQFGFEASLQIPKGPKLKASYIPIVQSNDSNKVNINVFNITGSYQFRKNKIQHVFTSAYIIQDCKSPDTLLTFNSHNLITNYVVTLKNGIQINASGTYIRFVSNTLPSTNSVIFSAGTGFTLFKIWNNSAGASLIYNFNEIKYGFYYQTSVPFLKVFTFNLRLENNQYNSFVTNPYIPVPYFSEFIARAGLAFRW